MSVTLDAPPQHPTWRVACDLPGCKSRLYIQAATDWAAVRRAEAEYGWTYRNGMTSLECPCFHEEVMPGPVSTTAEQIGGLVNGQ